MASLTNVEVGSIVYNLVSNIPTGISGTLPYLATLAVYKAQNYTGNTISDQAIGESYQPAIINLTISQVLKQMEAQGLGTQSVKIGELSITKGMKQGTSSDYEQMGVDELNNLGHKTSYYTTWN